MTGKFSFLCNLTTAKIKNKSFNDVQKLERVLRKNCSTMTKKI